MLFRLLILIVLFPAWAYAQRNPFVTTQREPNRDSLRAIFANPVNDLELIKAYRDLAFTITETERDTALYYFEKCILIARRQKWKLWEADAANSIGFISYILGNYPRAMQFLLLAKNIAEDPESEKWSWDQASKSKDYARNARLTVLQRTHLHLGGLYGYTGGFRDYADKELSHMKEAMRIAESLNDKTFLAIINMNMARHYAHNGDADSVLYWENRSLEYSRQSNYARYNGTVLKTMGDAYLKKGNPEMALQYYWYAKQVGKSNNNMRAYGDAHLALSKMYKSLGNTDSSLYYALHALNIYQSTNIPASIADAYNDISLAYQARNKIDSAFKYQGLALKAKEALDASDKLKQFQKLNFDEQIRADQLLKQQKEAENRIRTNALLGGTGTLLLVALLLLRNNRQRKKANTLLKTQKEELARALEELKNTQNQLIQSEKMASLGELTAGIAHEIQNPLNFVNNFSELNKELIVEMRDELKKQNWQEAESIAINIEENEEKIAHHGKRADGIVKGMLQHSRTSNGIKEPADINAICEEYVRLAYHGLRAKEKSFNANISTHFDNTIGEIKIIPQDIGRVVLNLVNNAFYAVNEKSRKGIPDYDPTVELITKKMNGQVLITVKDNGEGISEKTQEKIFQPFFTTKPTGEGTGLGLSLSYDIVTKGHQGELSVNSKPGQGCTFIIRLPV